MKFTEAKLEQTFAEQLQNEGYAHSLGDTLVRNTDEMLIDSDLHNFLLQKYMNDNITENEIRQIILQLRSLPASDLYESNKKFCRMLADGFILKREDHRKKDIYIQLIDYTGLERQRHAEPESLTTVVAESTTEYGTPKDRNIYRFVTQLEITGNEKRIPDGIIYINGLPLVAFEFKSAIREDATVFNAYEQLTVRYRRDIPRLFVYNLNWSYLLITIDM